MIITCISDLHGHYPELEGGDLLIVSGDLTSHDKHFQYHQFFEWFKKTNYKKRLFIGGNHDNKLNDFYCTKEELEHFQYLRDSGTEFEGLKIWGSPWTAWFHGINPNCKAFTKNSEDSISKKWDMIPSDTDILITHGPPTAILDKSIDGKHCGSQSLFQKIIRTTQIKLHVFGHIHEDYGIVEYQDKTFVNCSIMNENYKPTNKPVRLEWDKKSRTLEVVPHIANKHSNC